MPTPAPISGVFTLTVGQSTTMTDSTVGGTWSSSDTAIATVNSTTGVVTAIGVGSASIIYTVGSDSIAAPINVVINTITNGFHYDGVYNALKDRVKWQYQGVQSLSNRYFEDFHMMCDPQILLDMQPNSTYTSTSDSGFIQYLVNQSRSVIMEAVNAVYNAPQIIDPPTLCFFRPDVMLVQQPVPYQNSNQFTGIKMLMNSGDYAARFNKVSLFFNKTITFNLYLYNDMTLAPIYVKEVTTSAGEQVSIDLSTDAVFNYLSQRVNLGGIWYFGYYQSDIEAQGAKAIYYNIANNMYHGVRLWAYSAPTMTDVQGNRNFQRNNIGANNLTYGMNLEVSLYVDATNAIIQQSHLFDEVIGNMMAVRAVNQAIFSYRSNATQRNIAGIKSVGDLYVLLNGYKADEQSPYVMGLQDIVNRSIKTAKGGFQDYGTTFVGRSRPF